MKTRQILKKSLAFLASLKLAVLVIVALGVIAAVGTIYEARYDAQVAQRLVYFSPYMYAVMILLSINLIAVMVSRWPWKKHHTGFILAHIGIIITLIGAVLTQQYGIDGSLSVPVGESSRYVVVPDQVMIVNATMDGDNFRKIYSDEVDFIRNPPEEDNYLIPLGNEEIKIVDYLHFAYRKTSMQSSMDPKDGPAVRFQLFNDKVNETNWIRLPRRKPYESIPLGPAQVVIARENYQPQNRNEIVFTVDKENRLHYKVFLKRTGKIVSQGQARNGETIETGWMNLKLRVINILPRSKEVVEYEPADGTSPLAAPAIRILFKDQEYWIGQDSTLRLYTDNMAYFVTFGHKRLELTFPIQLKEFRVGRYQGTMRASSYESQVVVPELGELTISMNEPLDYKGFTFYQASFQENELGEPIASIFSVNYDPGRWVKYLGSFLIVLGTIVLFYFKRVRRKKHKVRSNEVTL